MASRLTDEERGRLYRYIDDYTIDGREPAEEPNLLVSVIFDEWLVRYKADKEQYEAIRQRRREAGRKGLERRWNKTYTTPTDKKNAEETNLPIDPVQPMEEDGTATTEMANDGIAINAMAKMADSDSDSESESESESEEKKKETSPEGEAKKKISLSRSRTLLTRKEDFYQSILPYADQYDREILNDFYQYWTELDKRRQRMRFEMQKTWETGKRLSTWARREVRN